MQFTWKLIHRIYMLIIKDKSSFANQKHRHINALNDSHNSDNFQTAYTLLYRALNTRAKHIISAANRLLE